MLASQENLKMSIRGGKEPAIVTESLSGKPAAGVLSGRWGKGV